MQLVTRVQQQRFGDSRPEIQMPAQQASAELAGHHQGIAGSAATAQQRSALRHFSYGGDGDHQGAIPTVGVTAKNRQAVVLREGQQSFV